MCGGGGGAAAAAAAAALLSMSLRGCYAILHTRGR